MLIRTIFVVFVVILNDAICVPLPLEMDYADSSPESGENKISRVGGIDELDKLNTHKQYMDRALRKALYKEFLHYKLVFPDADPVLSKRSKRETSSDADYDEYSYEYEYEDELQAKSAASTTTTTTTTTTTSKPRGRPRPKVALRRFSPTTKRPASHAKDWQTVKKLYDQPSRHRPIRVTTVKSPNTLERKSRETEELTLSSDEESIVEASRTRRQNVEEEKPPEPVITSEISSEEKKSSSTENSSESTSVTESQASEEPTTYKDVNEHQAEGHSVKPTTTKVVGNEERVNSEESTTSQGVTSSEQYASSEDYTTSKVSINSEEYATSQEVKESTTKQGVTRSEQYASSEDYTTSKESTSSKEYATSQEVGSSEETPIGELTTKQEIVNTEHSTVRSHETTTRGITAAKTRPTPTTQKSTSSKPAVTRSRGLTRNRLNRTQRKQDIEASIKDNEAKSNEIKSTTKRSWIDDEAKKQAENKETKSTTKRSWIDDEAKKQAEGAHYRFGAAIDDSITGNKYEREEERDGVNVRGSYSYSDGYYMITVHYVADDKGYRIIRQEKVPIGDGPEYNPDGEAKVSTYKDGKESQYKISESDIRTKKTKASRRVAIHTSTTTSTEATRSEAVAKARSKNSYEDEDYGEYYQTYSEEI